MLLPVEYGCLLLTWCQCILIRHTQVWCWLIFHWRAHSSVHRHIHHGKFKLYGISTISILKNKKTKNKHIIIIIIIIDRYFSTLYGSRIPQSAPRVKICSQAKGSAKVTSMLCVTDNKPELTPTLYKKAWNFNVPRYCSTGTRDHHLTWLSEPQHAIHPQRCLHV